MTRYRFKGHLGSEGGDDALSMNEGGVAQVVQAVVAEDLCASLEPHWLPELDPCVLVKGLWGDDAQGSQESPAGVDDLNLAVPACAVQVQNCSYSEIEFCVLRVMKFEMGRSTSIRGVCV